jgi:hypothetical protein
MRAHHHYSCIMLAALAVLAVVPAAAALANEPAPSGSPPPAEVTPCRVVDASLVTPLDSKTARGGEIFHFTATPADGAPSADGIGVVDYVHGAGSRGRAGEIALQARFLQLPDGTHLAAMIAPQKSPQTTFNGKSHNFSVPFIGAALGPAGSVFGVYNFLHSGSQAVIPAGTHLRVVLGDDYLMGHCALT